MVTKAEFDRANDRASEARARFPRAVAARYDEETGRIVVTLSSNVELSFSPEDTQGLSDARSADLATIEISPSGYGLHFPKLDADLFVPGLIEGSPGSREWIAARLGRAGGRSTSAAKRAAARLNGKHGGRPRLQRKRRAK